MNNGMMRITTSIVVAMFLVGMAAMATPVAAYAPSTSYTWDMSTPNYNPTAVIHPGTIDTTCLVMGDFLGISSIQPNAPGYGDSGVSVNWDDTWKSGIGDANTNGDDLDGLWAQIILPSEGWWDLGFETDRVVVFLSQDHGPYLAEGLETLVYGSNDLWGAVSYQAVLTDVYLDGWRTHNPSEDGNGNGWCSDDIAGVYELDGMYRYVMILGWSPCNLLNEPEVDAIGAVRVLEKTLSAREGELGDVVHVTVTVSVAPGETAEVVDTLPGGLSYIKGTFTLDGASATPKDKKGVISYTVTIAGTHVIEFDVKVDEAKSWEDMEVCNEVTASWFEEECTPICTMEDTECFTIHPFEALRKSVGLPKADVVFAIDLTGSMGNEIITVKAEASNIMASLATQIADVQFGLMSYMDYDGTYSTTEAGSVPRTYTAQYGSAASGDYPYLLDLDITANTVLMDDTINALTLGWGADGPQDYTRIIHEAWNDPNLCWREGAERILIIFGDNVPHDTNFDINNNGVPDNTGGDPGRDNTLGNFDDLDFEAEVASAAANGIHIMSVYSGGTGQKYAWEYMAEETDGGYFQLSAASMIPDAITELVEAQIEETLIIEKKTETQWAIVFQVTNPFGYTMTEVVIKDRFGGEIEIDDFDTSTEDVDEVSITHGSWSYYTKGKSEKVFLTWDIGDLDPGETARLIILVSTDLNPAGKQEYSSLGIYELNSGATLKFIDDCGVQLSAYTNSIYVNVKIFYMPHDCISITNDKDFFVKYNFPGTGTVDDPYIIENYIIDGECTVGIYVSCVTKHFVIRNCYLANHEYGIWISAIADGIAIISDNIAINNGLGFYIVYSNYITLSGNIAESNTYCGFSLGKSSYNILVGNKASNSNYGFSLSSHSNNNILSENTAESNWCGTRISWYSNDNLVYHNNFIDNGFIQIWEEIFSNNYWYHPDLQEGNYYSDYTGTDEDGDGIGDTPWSYDLYPFVNENGWI